MYLLIVFDSAVTTWPKLSKGSQSPVKCHTMPTEGKDKDKSMLDRERASY